MKRLLKITKIMVLLAGILLASEQGQAAQLPLCSSYGVGLGAGKACNTFNTQYVTPVSATCYDDSICMPSSLTSCNNKCLYDASYQSTNNPVGGGSCTTGSGSRGVCACNGSIQPNGFPSATCNPLQPAECEGATASTAPANGRVDCTWQSGVNNYVCGWSGGCSQTPATAASSQLVVQSALNQSCSTSADPGLMQDKVSGCFTGKTNIDVPEGKLDIKSVKVGQKVWSFDLKENKRVLGTVTQVFYHPQKSFWILKVKDGTTLEVTPNHPVYDLNQHKFVPVSELNKSSLVVTQVGSAIETHSILSNQDFGWVDDVYNIEVEPHHNYFAEGVLVHNKFLSDGNPHAADLRGTYSDYLTSCKVVCDPGYTYDPLANTCTNGCAPPVGGCAAGTTWQGAPTCACTAPPSTCANWSGSAWTDGGIRNFNLTNCNLYMVVPGCLVPAPTYIDPWVSCPNAGWVCPYTTTPPGVQTCGNDFTAPSATCACPAYTDPKFFGLSAADQTSCCGASAACSAPVGGCPAGQTWTGTPTCACNVCAVQACAAGQAWDAPTCACKVIPCDYVSKGQAGSGRLCDPSNPVGPNADCCVSDGYKCQMVGSQPLTLFPNCAIGDKNCTLGVAWVDGYTSTTDVLVAGTPVPGTVYPAPSPFYIGGRYMCVKPPNIPAAALSAPQIVPPVTVGPVPTPDPRAINWDANNNRLVCNLEKNDRHRFRKTYLPPFDENSLEGCACQLPQIGKPGYEPVYMSDKDFGNITYNIHLGNSRLDALWAQVLQALEDHSLAKNAVMGIAKNIGKPIPNAHAISGQCGSGSTGSGPGGQIIAGDSCDFFNGIYFSSVNGTCNGSLQCKPNAILADGSDTNCKLLCVYASEQSGISNNPLGEGCTTATGAAGTCSCGSFNTTNSYYPTASCSANPAPPASCNTLTAPANGSLSCTWNPGKHYWGCTDSNGCSGGPVTASSPTPPLVVTQNTTGQKCTQLSDPGVFSIVYQACFTGQTTIDTPEGAVEIQNLQVGQKVWSLNTTSKQLEIGTVTQTFYHPNKPYWILEAEDGNFLQVTPNHPVYDWSQDKFVEVSELQSSSLFMSITKEGFRARAVTGRFDFGLVDNVYNIEVEPQHNYFAKGLLVHNKFIGPGTGNSGIYNSEPDYLSACSPQCNAGYSYDSVLNVCTIGGSCAPQPCAAGKTWSGTPVCACMCTASPPVGGCPSGGAWDANTCACAAGPPVVAGTPVPLYLESGRTWQPTAAPALWSAAPQPYITPIPSNKRIACLQICPASAPRDPVTLMCTCALPQVFDTVNWSCLNCPIEGSIASNGACACPANYEVRGTACMPKLPSAEFVNDATSEYPVCGQPSSDQNSRIPVSYGFNVSDAAGNGVPSTTATATLPQNQHTYKYKYSSRAEANNTQYPFYFYSQAPHCACINHAYNPPSVGTVTFTQGKFEGDTLDFINSFDSEGLPTKSHGMVAIALNEASDGRNGDLFQTQKSMCACPNVNEIPGPATGANGPECKPAFSDPNQVLAVFDPKVDDLPGAKTQVLNRSGSSYSEPLNVDNVVVSSISLPNSQSSPKTLTPYKRHIWKCQLGYKLNLASQRCEALGLTQACDNTSPVAPKSAWATTVNKKLACCMNAMDTSTGAPSVSSGEIKFDCIENSRSVGGAALPKDFNELWKSSDDAADGGQINAVLLTRGAGTADAGGKPITGFYTLGGARCGGFSEFSRNPIQPGMVDPAIIASQQLTTGSGSSGSSGGSAAGWAPSGTPIPMPSSAGWNDMLTGLGDKARAPNPAQGLNGIQDARQCPILVRAALEYTCPVPSTSKNSPQLSFDTAGKARRCPTAASIKVHIRAEQVFTIAGEAPMVMVDTVLEKQNAASISIEQLIRKKTSGKCLPGMTLTSSGCRY